jgi:hypothetical protein
MNRPPQDGKERFQMTTVLECISDEGTIRESDDHEPRSEDDRPDPIGGDRLSSGRGGFAGQLVRTTLETARREGAAAAVGEMLRTDRFLLVFRGYLVAIPEDRRGESYGAGLIMIELMIFREAMIRGCAPRLVG